jgi:hypothetical protein
MGGYPGVEAGAVNFFDFHTECCQGPSKLGYRHQHTR